MSYFVYSSKSERDYFWSQARAWHTTVRHEKGVTWFLFIKSLKTVLRAIGQRYCFLETCFWPGVSFLSWEHPLCPCGKSFKLHNLIVTFARFATSFVPRKKLISQHVNVLYRNNNLFFHGFFFLYDKSNNLRVPKILVLGGIHISSSQRNVCDYNLWEFVLWTDFCVSIKEFWSKQTFMSYDCWSTGMTY